MFKIIAYQQCKRVPCGDVASYVATGSGNPDPYTQAVDGENVIYVTSELESALSVDRPVSWAEHATLGPPYLEKGKVVVDMPATNCRVRPYKPGKHSRPPC